MAEERDRWLGCSSNKKEVLKNECKCVFGRKCGIRTGDREEINGVGGADAFRKGHIAFIIAVMMEGRADVETAGAVFVPRLSFVGAVVDDNFAARGRKGCLPKIESAVKLSVRGELRINTGRASQI